MNAVDVVLLAVVVWLPAKTVVEVAIEVATTCWPTVSTPTCALDSTGGIPCQR